MAKKTEKTEQHDAKAALATVREELFKLNLDKQMRKLKNTRVIFFKRKEIARLLTKYHMKEVKNG
ncbi:MAG TPA: 50S ribosomal protein L29 [Patescibacteria group bacterium]|nr:50S ribosomal protein L29 [Patescibacteria group bacterium]